ncbi:hypothetical protein GIB67_004644 [Kingdonia uniflora]|uniref:Aspartic proteinase Asp1 n=1 Tax=Kingdonia uniflora TaxID=39325 RepID=A0A7J7MD60_9MAGN|nr:hypothetical protein GIB67_004644 [Kingdonia uniflora]
MEKKILLLLLFALVVIKGCSGAVNQNQYQQQNKKKPSGVGVIGSSVVFPIRGNVYPDGYFYTVLLMGNPPKPYYFDIDTGSDLTWLQCDAPCVSCSKVPHPLYRPNKNGLIFCSDPVCASLHTPENYKCLKPNEQCDYEVEYADQASSLGVLVRDVFPLRFTNGSLLGPRLAFGCGYDQQVSSATVSPTDGVLGLGNGKSSIVSQLRNMGLIQNVIGHCFSGRGGGFMFFGDDLVPSQRVVWTPMSKSSSHKHYSPGLAELLFGKQSTGVKNLLVIFDSGSSYTYFTSEAYRAVISSVRKDLTGKPLKVTDDDSLPVCWKGPKPFKSIRDVKKYFNSFVLSFADGKKAQLELPPEAYLIITVHGNVCLGILNGTEVGLQDINILGDISLQDRMVIYDNEKQQIGWVAADCNRLPKSGKSVDHDDEDWSQPWTFNTGILQEQSAGIDTL